MHLGWVSLGSRELRRDLDIPQLPKATWKPRPVALVVCGARLHDPSQSMSEKGLSHSMSTYLFDNQAKTNGEQGNAPAAMKKVPAYLTALFSDAKFMI